MKVTDFIPEFMEALEKQLSEDDMRWGDVWLKRTRKGQEERTKKRINEYFYDFETNGTPVPWLKIVGEALIGWIREVGAPEVWKE